MKFTINRELLLPVLQQIVGVIEKRQTMPVLANVLVVASENRLTMTGTDLEIQLVARIHADVSKPGAITIPARKFLDLSRYLPNNTDITLELQEGKVRIHAAKSRFMLNSLPAASYPEFSETDVGKNFSLPAKKLQQALGKTLFCMANQDVRYYLNGLLVHVSNSSLRLVASDGHRLAIFDTKLETPTSLEERLILPRKAAQELYRLLSDTDEMVTLHFSGSNIKAQLQEVTFSAKLIDAKYPDFSKVFQQSFFPSILLPKVELKESLTRASVLASEKFKAVTLAFEENLLTLSTQNNEHDEAEEQIPIIYSNEDLIISFNAQYLLDAISNLESDAAVFSIATNSSCCFIDEPEPVDYKFIVMPMRL